MGGATVTKIELFVRSKKRYSLKEEVGDQETEQAESCHELNRHSGCCGRALLLRYRRGRFFGVNTNLSLSESIFGNLVLQFLDLGVGLRKQASKLIHVGRIISTRLRRGNREIRRKLLSLGSVVEIWLGNRRCFLRALLVHSNGGSFEVVAGRGICRRFFFGRSL